MEKTTTARRGARNKRADKERLDFAADRSRVSACRAELLGLLQGLERSLEALAERLHRDRLPAFNGFHAGTQGRDHTYIAEALQTIQYHNDQEFNKSVVFPGLAAVNAGSVELIEQVNTIKTTLKARLLEFDRIMLRVEHKWHRLSDFLLRKTGYARLHRLQAYRHLSYEDIPIQVATFFWQKVKRSRTLSVEAIIERLESMPPGPQVRADLEKMYRCPKQTRFSLITTEGHSPAVNLLPVRNRLRETDRQQLLRQHPRLVLSANGRPFSDLCAVKAKAAILDEELGEPYQVVTVGEGRYGLFPKALLETLKPERDGGAIRWYQRAATIPVFYLAGDKPPYINTMASSPDAENKAPRQPRQNTRLESEPFLESMAVYRHKVPVGS